MAPRPFRFSVQVSNTTSATAWKETARRTEALGFSTLFVPDHYVDAASNGGQMLAAIPAMAIAAAVTDTLRIGARVFCIDYHYPSVLAKSAATLDFLSDGRLELGLGAGWVASEYEAMGLAMDTAPVRIARLAETVEFVKQFCAGADMSGGYKGQPASVQQPHPPIMIGGGARKVLTYAGQVADIVSFNFNNSEGRVGPAGVGSSTADAMDDKIAWVKAGAGSRFDSIELEVGAYFTTITDDPEPVAEKMGGMFGLSAADIRDHPNALIGSVDDVCERLLARRERYGFSYISVGERSMEAFAPVVERLAGQ